MPGRQKKKGSATPGEREKISSFSGRGGPTSLRKNRESPGGSVREKTSLEGRSLIRRRSPSQCPGGEIFR